MTGGQIPALPKFGGTIWSGNMISVLCGIQILDSENEISKLLQGKPIVLSEEGVRYRSASASYEINGLMGTRDRFPGAYPDPDEPNPYDEI